MNQEQNVTRNGSIDKSAPAAGEGVMRPPVDVFEDATGITLQADMPGVNKENLDIRIDKESLSLSGVLTLDMPKEMEPLHADLRATRYQRSFTLSGELDADRVEASLKDGVLTLRIPKREELKPRKIEVKAG
jgi:HSP20 family molecular chaperone IbpA